MRVKEKQSLLTRAMVSLNRTTSSTSLSSCGWAGGGWTGGCSWCRLFLSFRDWSFVSRDLHLLAMFSDMQLRSRSLYSVKIEQSNICKSNNLSLLSAALQYHSLPLEEKGMQPMTTLWTGKQWKAALPCPVPLTTLALVDGQWESPLMIQRWRSLDSF